MKDSISIEKVGKDPVKDRKIELVERKGIGHPDSISDGIAESISRKLCQEYRDRFGRILHHNTDEVQLVAGESEPEFGSGEMKKPIYMVLAGRATKKHEGEVIPVDELAVEAAKEYIDDNFKRLDPEHVSFESRVGETSADLKSVFNSDGVPLSNDTSFGVGHAPLSPVEKTVKELEHELHGEMREVGEDVKVMGLRRNGELKLTVAAALIGPEVESPENYQDVIREIRERAKDKARKETDLDVSVDVNAADSPEDNSFYLTVTGTSAEMGDDGSVGRGNRVNGLITPQRSMSLEAASGKNPVTHVGKIYNLLAQRTSRRISREMDGYAGVRILSQIGSPITGPQTVDVETSAPAREKVAEIVEEEVRDAPSITEEVVEGRLDTF
ncbi:MAG: methionine adenosyltransferase [Candidatus Nanohaloarchaea archaeon]